MLLPAFLGLFSQQKYELQLFHKSETMSKQQQLMLQTFTSQSNGVVLIQKPSKKDNEEQQDYKLLFKNEAAERILKTHDEENSLNVPVLKLNDFEE